MIKVPAIIYYLLVIAVRLRALFYCIVHFNNQKKLIISRLKKQMYLNKIKQLFENMINKRIIN